MSSLQFCYKYVLYVIILIACVTSQKLPAQDNSGNDCEIFDFTIGEFDCSPGNIYSAIVDFSVINPTQLQFEVWVNDNYFGQFELSQLPLEIENIEPVEGSDFDFIQVCINDNPNCCATIEYLQPECLGVDCEIGNIIVEPYECVDGFFLVDLTFEYTGVGETFTVFGNGNNYGTFSYGDLPITLGPFNGINPTALEFVIIDGINPDCTNAIDFGVYECDGGDCEIIELGLELGECNGETYSAWIFFEVINTTQEFFDLWINGEFVGFYELNEIPLFIDGIFPQDGFDYDYIEVCINDNPNCCASIEYLQPECLGGDCEIGSVIIEPYECVDGFFLVDLTFEYFGESDSFTVLGNGNNYGTFSYDDLPITLGPFNGIDPIFLEFVVIDDDNSDCTNFNDFGFYYCEAGDCLIENLVIDIAGCNEGGTYNMYFNFEVINSTNEFFDYSINNGEIEGFALISELPLYIDSIVPRELTDYDIIEVCVNDNPDCCAIIEYMQPECLTGIENISNENVEFNIFCENGIANLTLSNVSNDKFEITLYDITGRSHLIRQYTFSDEIRIDLSEFRNGAYLFKLIAGDEILVRKFVISN